MNKKLSHKACKAWVITVDMGYGHQRASFPLRKFAPGGIICANNYPGIPDRDKKLWVESRRFYEFISRFKKVPFLGEKAFELFDRLQEIPAFYPRRDLSRPNVQLKQIYSLFEKMDWGKHLIKKISKRPFPLVTTFFAVAMMAEYYNYEGDIFCVVCDADISRAWAPLRPQTSRINYLAPNKRVEERLKLYGIRPDKIYLTGFPLPDENVGKNLKDLKLDLGRRLVQLDASKVYLSQYKKTLLSQLGRKNLKTKPTRPLTITFAVGGAGAQRELGAEILKSLKKEILSGKVKLNLVAGVNLEVNQFFKEAIKNLGLRGKLNHGLDIIFQKSKDDYFEEFNHVLRGTDILWTKPSELSFYCALGLPIIMAPPIGSQEIFNQKWLTSIGAGMPQEDPRYTSEWLSDWLKSGWLAEAAMQGFLEAPKYGTYNIERIIFHRLGEMKKVKTVLQY
ncbi:MAG: hypothetical protein AAB358_01740 [Patescibacteria group bacterium]